jgi:hypothetical protein
MAPALLKPVVFIDDGVRLELPAGSPFELVAPEVELVADPHRLGLVLAALEDRRRRFRPGVAVSLGGRVRVISTRLVERGSR